VVVAEVVVPGDLAAEEDRLAAHALLEEGVPDAVHERHSPVGADHVGHGSTGTQVIEDRRAGIPGEQCLGEQRGDEVAGNELTCLVDEEAAVGVAVPGDAEVSPLGDHALADLAAVLLEQRVGLVVGERPVDLEVHQHRLERRPGEDQGCEPAGDAVRRVHHDLEREERVGVDEAVQVPHVRGVQVLRRARHALGDGRQLAQGERAPHELGHTLLAGEGQGSLADELHAVVLRRIVRGRDHRAAVEPALGDPEVEHLGRDQPDVEDRRPGGRGTGGERLEQPRRRGPRVHADAQ